MCDQQSLRSACAYAQSDQSLCLSLEYSMNVRLLAEHHLEFLCFKGGCTGSSESTPVKMPHYWKSHVRAHFLAKNEYALARRCHGHTSQTNAFITFLLNRGSYMSAHVLLNLLNELRKRDKMRACRAFYLFFATS